MTQAEQIKEILKLMELSSMEEGEKQVWTVMLPNMSEEELAKFKTILEKEVNQMTDIYLKVKSQKDKNG